MHSQFSFAVFILLLLLSLMFMSIILYNNSIPKLLTNMLTSSSEFDIYFKSLREYFISV